MDGIHDMGGMDGFGKVEPEPNEPPFHAPWEGRVMALARAMGYAGAWHIDHARFAQERLPPQVYLTSSYYQRWALAMETKPTARSIRHFSRRSFCRLGSSRRSAILFRPSCWIL